MTQVKQKTLNTSFHPLLKRTTTKLKSISHLVTYCYHFGEGNIEDKDSGVFVLNIFVIGLVNRKAYGAYISARTTVGHPLKPEKNQCKVISLKGNIHNQA